MMGRKKLLLGAILIVSGMLTLGTVRAEPETCNHEFVEHEVPGTCLDSGLRYWECRLCGLQYGYESTPALGHDFADWITDRPASCTDFGTESRICRRCGFREERDIPPAGHRFEEERTPPTCTRDGSVRMVCRFCGKREAPQPIPELGHSWDDGTVTKEPTRRAMGRRMFTCTRCGATRTEKIPRLETVPRPPVSRDPEQPRTGKGRLHPQREYQIPLAVILENDRILGPEGNLLPPEVRYLLTER